MTHTLPARVLVTDGHTNQALACVRSLGRAGCVVYVASHFRWPIASWSHYCRDSFFLADQTTQAYADLRDWARSQGIEIVMPITEAASFLCNAERGAWFAGGMTLGCGPEEQLLLAFDKARAVDIAARCGVTVPESRTADSLEGYQAAAAELGYPCVVKPRFSNPWHRQTILPDLGVAYVDGPNGLDAAVASRRQLDFWPVLQRYVPGAGRGIFALCNHGEPVAWFAHQRLRDVRPTGSGSSLRRSAALDSRLKAAAERLLRAMQWHGPAMVEFRDDGVHSPWLMEVNGRFWGSLQLAIAAGVDFPLLWLRLLRGEPVAPNDVYKIGVTLRWLWGDLKRFGHILRGRPSGYTGAFPSVLQGLRELLGPTPQGTRLETWDWTDPWPSIGQGVQGILELLQWRQQHHREPEGVAPVPTPPAEAS